MIGRLDIVIFGATGFTGKRTALRLHKLAKETGRLLWGISGRNETKLRSVLKYIQTQTGSNWTDVDSIPTIVADVEDKNSLRWMASHARVVINCSGPYRFYGEAVVKACIESGTHHVDVSGEPEYMEKMQLKYNKAAEEAGVYVISACGADSIPADMGVTYLAQNFNGIINSVEIYTGSRLQPAIQGAFFNYATWESLINGLANVNELKSVRSKLFANRLPSLTPKLKSKGNVHKNPIDGAWSVPMAGADKAVMRRTQRFLYEKYNKRPIQVEAYFNIYSLPTLMFMYAFGPILNFLVKSPEGRSLLLKYPELFSNGLVSRDGPSEKTMENAVFVVTLIGKGWEGTEVRGEPNKTVTARVTVRNPAYGFTCDAAILSALTIIKESHKIPNEGGVLTPGAAFAGTSLIEQLQKYGTTFEIISSVARKSKL